MYLSADKQFDVIVIGGGHAGAEAAWAAANLLRGAFEQSQGRCGRVALLTMDPAKTGAMSCNPAIGGLAKGQIVREIDALGGLMALAADATGIQFRVLNQSKGPAVRGPRCQSDKYAYAAEVQRLLATRPNLDHAAALVERIHVEAGRVRGVLAKLPTGEFVELPCKAVVLTTGTFMRALMHTGERKDEGGRVGEGSAVGISGALRDLGFDLGRLKTGTPPRLAAQTIDFAALEVQHGDEAPMPFSDMTGTGHATGEAYATLAERFPVLEQRTCWMTHTGEAVHELIRNNLDRAPMYNGQIDTAGPRYCPSIEDKVVRFSEKSSHHVFLEPESLSSNEIYCNGISTSLPADVQDVIVRSLPGCEKAKILRYGYAVEYDMVWPHQIDATCMTKAVEGLFLAGQINGTSGYEEAAGQGLIAGLNSVRLLRGESLVRFGREQAYLGVMMDDLVTKTPREPYRMFTSRAEFRLLLRADNSDARLTALGRELGLVDDARWAVFERRQQAYSQLSDIINREKTQGKRLIDHLRAPDRDARWLLEQLNGSMPTAARDMRIVDRLVADVQYAGYIKRHEREYERLAAQEHKLLPLDMDYTTIGGLRTEASLTLNRFRPATLGQAARLAGVTPADLMVVSIALGR